MSSIVQSYPSLIVASANSPSQADQSSVASAYPLEPSPSAPYTLSAATMASAPSSTPLTMQEVTNGTPFTLRFPADPMAAGSELVISNFLFDMGNKNFLSLSETDSKHFYMNESWLMARHYRPKGLFGIRLKDPWLKQLDPWLGRQGMYSMGAWWDPQEPSPPWGKFRVDWTGPKGILLMEPLPLPLESIPFDGWLACVGPIPDSTVLVAKFEGAKPLGTSCRRLGNCTLEST